MFRTCPILYYWILGTGFVSIPDLSMDGVSAIPVPLGTVAFQSVMCGAEFGLDAQPTSAALICKLSDDVDIMILFLY